MQLRVALLGAGSWGTTVAALVAPRSPTMLWARSGDVAREINTQHKNERYLPRVRLPRSLRASDSIEETIRDADVVVVRVPSIGFRAVLEEVKRHLRPWVPIVSLSKGLEENTHLRMTEVIAELLPGHLPELGSEADRGARAKSGRQFLRRFRNV
jgi:glycerol-3-phosphate dehydrogenase (NAD(P)+)